MTKAQRRKILFDAAEDIETAIRTHSCSAISLLHRGGGPESKSSLATEYSLFFDKSPSDFWLDWECETLEERKNLRVLLILMFEHAEQFV